MSNMFSKDIMDCMKDCILSIFWPEKDIIDFFKRVGCTYRELPLNGEVEELHRSEIINRVFIALESRADSGLGQFRCMLRNLVEWDYFNPYYFDKLKKLDRSTAKQNLEHLKLLQEVREAKIKEERFHKKEKEKQRDGILITKEEIKCIFLNLFSGKDQDGREISQQKRGYLFEEFLKKLFAYEKIEVTEPFKIMGEQIDGSFKYDGEHYLVEAKWQETWSATESLYQFAMKTEGKMYGRGIFVSINGFSPDSVKALINGKAIKTILIDGGDLALVTEGMLTLKEMLDGKIKAAQTMGKIYVDASNLKDKIC